MNIRRIVASAVAVAVVSGLLSGCSLFNPQPVLDMDDARQQAHELVDDLIAQIPEDVIIRTQVTSDRPFWFKDGANPDAVPSHARYSYGVYVVMNKDRWSGIRGFWLEVFHPYVDELNSEGGNWDEASSNNFTTRYVSPPGVDQPWVLSADGLSSDQVEVDGELYVELGAFSPPAVWDQEVWDESSVMPQIWPASGVPEGGTRVEMYSPRWERDKVNPTPTPTPTPTP